MQWAGEVLLKHIYFVIFYKIMAILPVMKDHPSWETTKFNGPLYRFHCSSYKKLGDRPA